MCIDIVEAQRAVDKYCDMYPAFQDTRECKLLRVSIKHAQVVCIRTTGIVCHFCTWLACCADLIYPRLVTPISMFWPPTDSVNYQKHVLNFLPS